MKVSLRDPISDLAHALRVGRTTATALAEEAIANHAAHDAILQAYKTFVPERVLAEAAVADAAFKAGIDLGPFQGIPVSVKDLYGVASYPTFAGTPAALPEQWQAEGPVIAALRGGLAVVSGKTHTVEFAFGGIGTNPHWGTPRNPWDAAAYRVPGGSSSGAGGSLWEGSAAIALGSDTAGSVRLPASFTGTVGLKTSIDRWSCAGIVPLSPSLDTPGVLAREVSDAALAFAIIDPETTEDPRLFLSALGDMALDDIRIGVAGWFFEDCAPGIAEGVEIALEELVRAGAIVVDAEFPEFAEAAELFGKGGLAAPEFAAFINSDMAASKGTLDPNVAARFERFEAITAVEYLTRRARVERLAASVDARFVDVDILVGPTAPITPPTLAEVADGRDYMRANMAALRNTSIGNLMRLCGISLPVAKDDAGMPVGMQLMAAQGDDERMLAAALAVERVLGTARQRLGMPPLISL